MVCGLRYIQGSGATSLLSTTKPKRYIPLFSSKDKRLMKLDEFKAYIEAERKAQQLTNLEKIAKIVVTTNTKGKN